MFSFAPPGQICDLSTLLELAVGYNRIEEIHPKIGALESLERLLLPFNQVRPPASSGAQPSAGGAVHAAAAAPRSRLTLAGGGCS